MARYIEAYLDIETTGLSPNDHITFLRVMVCYSKPLEL